MNITSIKTAKAIAGVVVLVVLVLLVMRWYGDYRIGQTERHGAAVEGTSTPGGDDATKTPDSKDGAEKPAKPNGKSVIVLTDGLNFRDQASPNAKVIRGLKKGEKLTLISEKPDWYEVQASDGVKGWISASATYSKVQ